MFCFNIFCIFKTYSDPPLFLLPLLFYYCSLFKCICVRRWIEYDIAIHSNRFCIHKIQFSIQIFVTHTPLACRKWACVRSTNVHSTSAYMNNEQCASKIVTTGNTHGKRKWEKGERNNI